MTEYGECIKPLVRFDSAIRRRRWSAARAQLPLVNQVLGRIEDVAGFVDLLTSRRVRLEALTKAIARGRVELVLDLDLREQGDVLKGLTPIFDIRAMRIEIHD